MFKRMIILMSGIVLGVLIIVLRGASPLKKSCNVKNNRQLGSIDIPPMGERATLPAEPLIHVLGPPDHAELSLLEPESQVDAFVPAWIRDEGDFYRERISVNGQWVERVRGRYAWDNGSEVEVEVSDLGEHATADQLKSLGFNLDMESNEETRTLRKRLDNDRYLANLEYDEESREGMIQCAVKHRYLLEVKLQNLPLESFRILEECNGTLQGLLDIQE